MECRAWAPCPGAFFFREALGRHSSWLTTLYSVALASRGLGDSASRVERSHAPAGRGIMVFTGPQRDLSCSLGQYLPISVGLLGRPCSGEAGPAEPSLLSQPVSRSPPFTSWGQEGQGGREGCQGSQVRWVPSEEPGVGPGGWGARLHLGCSRPKYLISFTHSSDLPWAPATRAGQALCRAALSLRNLIHATSAIYRFPSALLREVKRGKIRFNGIFHLTQFIRK